MTTLNGRYQWPGDSTSKIEAITWNILSDKSDSKSGKADAVIWRTNKSEARALLQLDVDLEDAGIETGRGKDYQTHSHRFPGIQRPAGGGCSRLLMVRTLPARRRWPHGLLSRTGAC